MRSSPYTTFALLSVFVCGAGFAQQAPSLIEDRRGASSQAAMQQDTPALHRIADAQQQIAADPKKVQAYNELALAFLCRTRETADPKYLKDAESALAQGLKLNSEDFQLQRTQVSLMLSRHQFAQARELGLELERRNPDDILSYGLISEADIALGNYPEAEEKAQWMMNLRPNNTPALILGSRLRVLFGGNHGAIDFLYRAYSQTSPDEVEELAWIANQIASIQIASGQTDAATHTLEQAEQLFPHYPATLENLATIRMTQNRASDAVQLWMQAASMDHDPHALYELAQAQQAAGDSEAAHATSAKFVRLVSDPSSTSDQSRLDMILMYAGNSATAADALKLAEKEVAARQDVWTLDAYAWALYANAKYEDADAALQKAMAVGIQSAQILDHAGHVAQKLGRNEDASKYFKLSVQSNPSSEFTADALKSANLTAEKVIPQQNPAQNSTDLVLNAASLPVMAAINQVGQPAEAVTAPMAKMVPEFSPVPEALLTPKPTDTSRVIHSAQAILASNPKNPEGYAGLGAAYFQRARETGDVSDYQLAEEALTKSLDIDSSDFSAADALESMAEVCMGEHRFADALKYSQKALSLGTGDVSPFAIVGDAYADMGEYDKAAAAYARLTPRDMMLSPRAAFARDSRLSYLKFVTGDTAAAISLMKTAVAEGVEAQLPRENLSWLYYELGEYEMQAGDPASADAAYLAALKTHPGDYRALAALGKLRANNGRYDEAIELYQKAIAVVPMPIFVAELGDLYAKAGNKAEAQKQYALVEYIGLLGHINQVLHNRDLALFYADHDMKLAEALDLAQKELEVRHDVYTWDALAWALYKNGKLAEAAQASEKATRFGTRDSLLLFHAGMIAAGLGQREQAHMELKQALEVNPHFHVFYAKAAKVKLDAIDAQATAKEGSNDHAR